MAYVLADETAAALKPPEWAARAVALYRRLEADALRRRSQPGRRDGVGGHPRGRSRRAGDERARDAGKFLRAEPVSVLYAQGRVRHAGTFPALEDEMCDFSPTGLSSSRSPDRLDALVWALTDLMLARRAEPRVRVL